MNQYRELLQKHQQEVNVLPIRYAFGEQQFREMMNAWGLDPEKDLDKIYRLGEDKTGDGFIYQMFLCELANHEYNYTEDVEETLDALGYTWEQIMADKRLLHGLKMAQKKITGQG